MEHKTASELSFVELDATSLTVPKVPPSPETSTEIEIDEQCDQISVEKDGIAPGNALRRRSCVSVSTLGDRSDGLSYIGILLNFLKGMVGSGCLALPLAFRQAGLWTGLSLVFGIGFLNFLCMQKLVLCSQKLSKFKGNSALDYGNLAKETFSSSFPSLRRYNLLAKFIVNGSISCLQIGVCGVIYVFVAEHLKEFFDHYFSHSLATSTWMFLIFVPMVLIAFVRSLRAIAVFSAIGNVFCFASLAYIFQHLIFTKHQPLSSLPPITNFEGVMSSCGAVLYAFEGQAMVLPLENRLRKPSHMVGPLGILSVGMALVSAVYATSGFLGYITFGTAVRGSITQNLPVQHIDFVVVKLMFTLVMYCSFCMQLYVIVDMLWPQMSNLFPKIWPKLRKESNKMLCMELLFRTALVAVAMCIALTVPDLDHIIPLVGITTGLLLALIVPPLLDLCLFLPVYLAKGQRWRAFLLVAEDVTLAAIGLFAMITGLRANILRMAVDDGTSPE